MLRRLLALVLTVVIISNQLCDVARAASTYDQQFYSGNDILFYDPRCSSGQATGYVTLNGKDNLEKILTFFMQHGLTLAQASGIAGNFMAESGLDPTIIQGGGHAQSGSGYSPVSGVGFGLAQWTSGGRQTGLVQETQQLGVDVTDLGGQLSYAWKELSVNYPNTLVALKATDNPVDAAVTVHDGYESSADSRAAVVNNRGGNAQKFYNMYSDAPALAGSTSDVKSLSNVSSNGSSSTTSGACVSPGFGNGDIQNMVKQYAWSQYISYSSNLLPETGGRTVFASDQTPAYAAAVVKAHSEDRYTGGISVIGDDCGGFVSILMYDSGFDKGYNSGDRGGPTTAQEAWLRQNWQQISSTDATDRQPGDVAINNDHTYVYVGNIPGFGSQIASASVSGPVRAPMAGQESVADSSFRWYRKKANLTPANL
ncbi:MAG: hypothetical protein H6797_00010 [Candidatus Nomurabacteria bacterium]|nr:MAG: hypothetical protein H6797_00010 [Candidatus Nomurabacteria bacterium]